MFSGWALVEGIRNSVTTPAGVMRPTLGPRVNQKFPSGPSVSAPPSGACLTTPPWGLMTVTGKVAGCSPNPLPREIHRLPSSPAASGPALRSVGSGNTVVVTDGVYAWAGTATPMARTDSSAAETAPRRIIQANVPTPRTPHRGKIGLTGARYCV